MIASRAATQSRSTELFGKPFVCQDFPPFRQTPEVFKKRPSSLSSVVKKTAIGGFVTHAPAAMAGQYLLFRSGVLGERCIWPRLELWFFLALALFIPVLTLKDGP